MLARRTQAAQTGAAARGPLGALRAGARPAEPASGGHGCDRCARRAAATGPPRCSRAARPPPAAPPPCVRRRKCGAGGPKRRRGHKSRSRALALCCLARARRPRKRGLARSLRSSSPPGDGGSRYCELTQGQGLCGNYAPRVRFKGGGLLVCSGTPRIRERRINSGEFSSIHGIPIRRGRCGPDRSSLRQACRRGDRDHATR